MKDVFILVVFIVCIVFAFFFGLKKFGTKVFSLPSEESPILSEDLQQQQKLQAQKSKDLQKEQMKKYQSKIRDYKNKY